MTLLLYTHDFLTSLVFTCSVETVVLFLYVRYALGKNIPAKELIFAGIFASFATITYVWYVFPVMVPKAAIPATLSEPFTFLVEAIFYRFVLRLRWSEAFAVSFVANTVSYLAGPALRQVGLWPRW